MLKELIKPLVGKKVSQILQLTKAESKNQDFYQCLTTYFTQYYGKTFKFSDFYVAFSEDYLSALKKRKDIKIHTPLFRRYLRKRFMRLSRSSWRRPRGLHNKLRKHIKGKGAHPKIGYRKPALVRGVNAKGYRQFVCKDLYQLNEILTQSVKPNEQYMIKIARTVGLKKRVVMENLAHKHKIYVTNKYKWELLLSCNFDN